MHRIFLRTGFAAVALIALGGCDQLSALGLGPPPAASAPPSEPPVTARVIAELRPHAGDLYSDFSAGEGARYSPEQLGLNASDRARLWRSMAAQNPGRLLSGGGAEALVFTGCAEAGCDQGLTVVAVDTTTGTAFVAVRDAGGAEVLTPNDRVEALLRLNSPTRAWDNAALQQTASTETTNP